MGVLPGVTVLRIVITVFFLPLLCGSFFAVRVRKYEGPGILLKAYLYGWIAVFALFELICVPFVVTLGKFSSFCRVYNVCVFLLAVCSLSGAGFVFCRKRRRMPIGERQREKAAYRENASGGFTRVLWGIVIVSVLAQTVYFYFYNHMNGDDSYYIAESVITDFFDTMFQRDAYTGMPLGLDVRHALATLPLFVTWLARMCGLHAATAAHAILGPVLLGMMYGVYTLLGQALFEKEKRYVPVFVLIVEVWYVWGNVSIFTPETFLYTRTWQGKAVFANIIVPLALYLLCRLIRQRRAMNTVLLMMVSVAGIFTTTAAVYLLTALFGLTALYCLISERKWGGCLRILLCLLPELCYGGIYLYLLRVW